MATSTSALTKDDPRYEEMFSVEKETESHGGVMIQDLYPKLAAMREQGPVIQADIYDALTGVPNTQMSKPHVRYTTLTFETTNKALIDNSLYSSLHYHEMPSVMMSIGHTILTMVGNEHGRYRSSIQPIMTRQQAMGWWREKWIEPFVADLIDGIERQKDGADLTTSLCGRLPMHTVTAAYGLTSDEALDFRDSLLTSMSAMASPEARAAAHGNVRNVLLNAIAERRQEARDDLISRLIEAPFTDADGKPSRLSDEDILAFSRLLLLAGGGTTFRQMGILIFALLSNRDQLEDLRAERELMQPAIEESLRWECTDPVFHRLAMRDSVLGGVEIPEGAVLDVCLGAANRDPARWTDP
ncbi:MAG: cytochrome P450, partial [Sphingomonadales bacterium]